MVFIVFIVLIIFIFFVGIIIRVCFKFCCINNVDMSRVIKNSRGCKSLGILGFLGFLMVINIV